MARPTVSLPFPSISIEDVDFFLLEFEQQDKETEAGVLSEGDAAAYALVWEWGNMRQTQIGPRTTLGVNPDGQHAFLSIQAPRGYIRINEPLYWTILEEEMAKAKFASSETGVISDELRQVAWRAAKRIADVIREYVPVDTGALYSSIKPVRPEDMYTLGIEEDDRSTLVLSDIDEEPVG